MNSLVLLFLVLISGSFRQYRMTDNISILKMELIKCSLTYYRIFDDLKLNANESKRIQSYCIHSTTSGYTFELVQLNHHRQQWAPTNR